MKKTKRVEDSALIIFNPIFAMFPKFFKILSLGMSWTILFTLCAASWFVIRVHFGFFACVSSFLLIFIMYSYNIGSYRPNQLQASEDDIDMIKKHLDNGGSLWTLRH